MARVFRIGNFSVYVQCETGAPHHRPHGHIKRGAQRVASVFIDTLTIFHATETLPRNLLDRLQEEQSTMIQTWIELNEQD